MTWTIPKASQAAFRRGDEGIGVWGLQRALQTLPRAQAVVADGRFEAGTELAVRDFQAEVWPKDKRQQDGIAGPATQRAIATRFLRVHDGKAPAGLLDGFAEMEGGWLLAAINRDVAGGVDCGLMQRRVYEEDYDDGDMIERAFDTRLQVSLAVNSLVDLRAIFQARPGTRDHHAGIGIREKAWRLAALNHNYPEGADRLSRTPVKDLSTYWTTEAAWTKVSPVKGGGKTWYRFPDGSYIKTPLDWCASYAGVLGAGYHGHPGNVTAKVTSWT